MTTPDNAEQLDPKPEEQRDPDRTRPTDSKIDPSPGIDVPVEEPGDNSQAIEAPMDPDEEAKGEVAL